VRGDSLRDFYAKVLAIAGLGVLAGVGALVDYWPTGDNVPALVAGATFRPELSKLDPAPLDLTLPSPVVLQPRRAAARPVPTFEPVTTLAATGFVPVGEAVALSEFSAPPVSAAPVAPATAAPAEPIELTAPPADRIAAIQWINASPPIVLPAPSEPGFLMGTLRKTGAGIAKTGAVTGATIMDAFRGVAGAFKKVSPFRDRGFVISN